MGRPIFDHKIVLRGRGATTATELQGTLGIHLPWATGTYYPETFTEGGSTTERLTSSVTASTWIGPFFAGAPRSWDRIGMFVRHASSPGTSPDYRFVIYALDDATLFPTSLLYQGALRAPAAITATWEEDTLTLDTTATWLGIGWHYPAEIGETIGVRGNSPGAPTAGQHLGYTPYGMSRSVNTLTPIMALYAAQAAGTTTAPAVGLFTLTPPGTGTNNHLSSGAYLRRA